MNQVFRIFLFVAVAAGIGGFFTMQREESPRLVHVKPADKRPEMPDFTYPSISGAKWRLSDQRGNIVLVNFWATWCGPCRRETPALVRVYDKYRGRGVQFSGIAMDSRPQQVVPPFAKRYGITYPILVPTPESALANAIESLPTTFLLDRQGRVARTWLGALHEEELTMNVEELLAEAGG